MKRTINQLLNSVLIIGFISSMTTAVFAQNDRRPTRRTPVEARKEESKDSNKKSESKNSERKEVKKQNAPEAAKRGELKKSERTHSDRVIFSRQDQERSGNARDRSRDNRGRNDDRVDRDRNNDRDRNDGRVDRDRANDHDRVVVINRSRYRNPDRAAKKDLDWYKRDHRDHHNWHHPYWNKHHRPRKKYYKMYGWSPFFYLNLSPIVRFRLYTQPLIHQTSHIVFTKEYDLYDYRPGDAIGYSVHINFGGRVEVYDRFYDRAPQLVDEFYIGHRQLQRLERILDYGRYYDDGRTLYDNYGQDDHPGYATIGYRNSPNHRLGTVSLNLSAPSHHHPQYFTDFMREIDALLYDRGYF